MTKNPLLLICDDDKTLHLSIKQELKGVCECRSAYDTDEAQTILKNTSIDILLLDIQMRTGDEGIKALPKFREIAPEIAIVMMSGLTDFRVVREALQKGANDYIAKDLEKADLPHVVRRLLARKTLLDRRDQQNSELLRSQQKHQLIGDSPAIRSLRKTIEKIRNSPANVLITGETGTGKEVVARQLRKTLPDGSLAPFVAVDSSTIQSTMAESLLFGHEKGAFTGAEQCTKGMFEEADGGIIYFDEISNMPLNIQAKLLRVIQEKEITRLGASRVIPLEFRVICASNKNLEEMVRAGQFKEDLLQRLNVLPIQLSPLHERKEDIPLLVDYFIRQQPVTHEPLHFTEEALSSLQAYPWPGNVRELANTVLYVATMAENAEIDLADLPPKFRENPHHASPPGASGSGQSFYDQVAEFEKSVLQRALEASNGNVSQLAIQLGMDRSHLYSKLKEYGLSAGKKKT